MKRLLAMSIAMVLLVGMLVIPASSFAATSTGVVHGGWLRLRAQPNFNAATLNSYYTGTVVTILETLSGWYRVKAPDGKTGYMYSSYVTLGGGGGGGVGTYTVWSANGYGVRMRSGPGTGYRVLAVYSVGTSVTVLQKGSYWSYIRVGNLTGYMMNQFLTSGTPPVPTPDGNASIWSANGYGVRLRTGPSKGYGIIGVYSVGTTVKILERGPAGGWDYIQVGSRTGYMMNEFLHYFGSTEVTAVTLNYDTPVKGCEMRAASITPYGATVSYQWMVDGNLVSTNPTYVASVADVGKHITLVVTGTGSYTGSTSVTTKNTVLDSGAITSVTLNTTTPVVSNTLWVDALNPVGALVSYQWLVGGVLKSSAATYTVVADDVGKDIKLVVTGQTPFSGTVEVPTAPVQATGSLLSVGIVNNTTGNAAPNVGDKLSATYAPALATVRYEWYVTNGTDKALVGTGSTYTVSKADATRYAGGYVLLWVYGTGAYQNSDPNVHLSAQTLAITDLPLLGSVELSQTSPKVTSTPETITATARLQGGTPTTDVQYIWYADGVAIPGETTGTLTVTGTLLGKVIKAQAIANGTSCGGSATSGGTNPVKGVIFTVAVDPANPIVGDVMRPVLTPAEATATYIWYAGTTPSTMVQVGTGPTHTISLTEYANGYRYYQVRANGTGAYTGSALDSAPTTPAVPAPLMAMMEMAAEEGLTLDETGMPILPETGDPADETGDPADETGDPTDETDVPTDETDVPTDETDDPTDETDVPTDETDDPTDETDVPTDETDDPTDETDVPTDEDVTTDETDLITDVDFLDTTGGEGSGDSLTTDLPPVVVTYELSLGKEHPVAGDELIATLTPPLEPGVLVRYEWFVGDDQIYDAITNAYTVKETDLGHRITVKIWIGDSEIPLIGYVDVKAPKVETPKVETPKVETPKVEAPEVEAPDGENSDVETPEAGE